LVIWGLAALALRYGDKWSAERTEPYFQLVSGLIIIGMAVWMFLRVRRDQRAAAAHSHDGEGPNGGKLIDTGHGLVEVTVFETGVPPRFRLFFMDAHKRARTIPDAGEVTIKTLRPDGAQQVFTFVLGNGFLEASAELPEPHEFDGVLLFSHSGHTHEFDFQFREDEHHHHHELDLSGGEYQDAHEQAHARDILKRFSNRSVTTGQIVLFGLTGGLMPCPAALTVLLVCLQLKKFTLGFTLVLCFSLGLAVTMVASGALAAWGVHHASKRIQGFGRLAQKAPYVSSLLLIIMGSVFAYLGIANLR
jgi:nickel/cobalt exporter